MSVIIYILNSSSIRLWQTRTIMQRFRDGTSFRSLSLISALIQCHFDYTCSAWYNGLSKKLKCRMQCTQNKIIRFMLNAPWRFHVGANEFKHVGLLPIEYRVEQ